MIVTSKRCFINVLAQFMDRDTLLQANYYIADVKNQQNNIAFNDSLRYNESGELVFEKTPTALIPSFTKYNIRYGGGELDPTPFMTTQLMTGGVSTEPMEAFIRSLYHSETIAEVYNFLYGDPPKGNGLRILIFYDEDTVRNYAHIVCEYLAKNFGEDITFIDPTYRPDVKGQSQYIGDKAYAQKTIHDLQDYTLLSQFNQAITQLGYDASMNNLSVWLGAFDAPALGHLYELLYPNDPVPPGKYSADDLRTIILGRVSEDIPAQRQQVNIPNLYTTDAYLQELQKQLEGFDFNSM